LYLSMCTGASFSLCLYPYLPYYSNISSRFGNLSHTINGKGKTNVYIEKFEDIKGVIRIRKSKNKQHNDQKKKDKQRSTKHYTENLKIEQHSSSWGEFRCSGRVSSFSSTSGTRRVTYHITQQ
jgi:hypothetical protein